jgi:hypothetical protein
MILLFPRLGHAMKKCSIFNCNIFVGGVEGLTKVLGTWVGVGLKNDVILDCPIFGNVMSYTTLDNS